MYCSTLLHYLLPVPPVTTFLQLSQMDLQTPVDSRRSYSMAQYQALVEATGFSEVAVYSTDTPYSVMDVVSS